MSVAPADLFALLALGIQLLSLCGVVYVAWAPRWGSFRDSVANPGLLVLLLSTICLVDFLFLMSDGRVRLFEIQQWYGRYDVSLAFFSQSLIFAGLVAGMLLGIRDVRPASPIRLLRPSRRAVAALLVVCFVPALFSATRVLLSLSDILEGKINRQLLFSTNPLLLVGLGLVVPSLAIAFGSVRAASVRGIGLLTLASVLILLTGSRGSLFLIGLVYSVALIKQGRRLPSSLLLLFIPLGVFLLTLLRFVFRESWRYDTLGDFVRAKGGLVPLYFDGAEIGLADAFTVLFHELHDFGRPPFESFLGILMYPVPRTLFEFKPVSASAQLTEALSPRNWSLTKSEILASGSGDLLMQFGAAGAVLVAAVLGYVWIRACLRAAVSEDSNAVLALPSLLFVFYIGYRGALFNIGSVAWPIAVTAVTYVVLCRLDPRKPSLPAGS